MNVQLFNHTNDTTCDCCVIHKQLVNKARRLMPEENSLLELADLLRIFGDSTRVRIISALLHAELCVCDIAVLLGMTKSAISHQLRALRQTKLVKRRKAGKIVYYSLDDEHVSSIFKLGLAHVRERK
ncbi:MAG: metalloregulator ArsR/SmtB family transcription factor [Candidatus Margulisbacteria bacterium]|jgi:DNA-binding transcriptional ArsR family regulator|nr:metalloregulator ArsR/SmtB family transcription factor [Candidatus Margulisiibacteriota bacterium]